MLKKMANLLSQKDTGVSLKEHLSGLIWDNLSIKINDCKGCNSLDKIGNHDLYGYLRVHGESGKK